MRLGDGEKEGGKARAGVRWKKERTRKRRVRTKIEDGSDAGSAKEGGGEGSGEGKEGEKRAREGRSRSGWSREQRVGTSYTDADNQRGAAQARSRLEDNRRSRGRSRGGERNSQGGQRSFGGERVPLLDDLLSHNDKVVTSALGDIRTSNVLIGIDEFNGVLSTLGKKRHWRAAVGLIRILQSDTRAGRRLRSIRTVKTFTIMLDIYGKAGYLDQAFSLFFEMQEDCRMAPSQITYNALISACSRNDEPELGREVFEDMQRTGLIGDKFTYGSLIDSHAKRGNVEAAFEISRLMDAKRVRKDQTIYAALMEACGRVKQLPRALRVFEEMKRQGVWPNLITFAVIIDCCANSREPYKAFEMFGEMRHWGLSGNVVTWTGLIHACAKAGWPERAEMVLSHMRKAGVEPNEVTFGALIDAWTRVGRLDRAFDAIRSMADVEGVAPNSVLVGGLVDSCRRDRKGEYIGQIWDLICEYNLSPARHYFPSAIALSAFSGDVETSLLICSHCHKTGMLRWLSFRSSNPVFQSLAYSILVLSKAIERRKDREMQMMRLKPILKSLSMDGNRETYSLTMEETFEKVLEIWERGLPFEKRNRAAGKPEIHEENDNIRVVKTRLQLKTAREALVDAMYGDGGSDHRDDNSEHEDGVSENRRDGNE